VKRKRSKRNNFAIIRNGEAPSRGAGVVVIIIIAVVFSHSACIVRRETMRECVGLDICGELGDFYSSGSDNYLLSRVVGFAGRKKQAVNLLALVILGKEAGKRQDRTKRDEEADFAARKL